MIKNKLFKTMTLVMGIALSISILSGCAGSQSSAETGESIDAGSILVVGSSALQPLAQEAAVQFNVKYPNSSIQVQGGGSGTGLKSVSDGTAQIGMSDIFAEEKSGIDAAALTDYKVAVAGFAAVVNPKVQVDNLTKEQLVDIFTGKVTNWKQVGGNDMEIVVVNRPASSGTRATFKKYALDGKEEVAGKALTEDSSGAVQKTVGDTDGAISYLALSYLKNNSIKPLKIDGVEPTAENIKDGKYPVWSYEHMYTKGEAQGIAKKFIEYMMSDEVKPVISKMGYIPVGDMKVTR